MKHVSVLFACTLGLLAGCSAEGVRLPLPGGTPSQAQLQAFRAREAPSPASARPATPAPALPRQAAQSAAESLGKRETEALFADQRANRLIVIGNVGPFRRLKAPALAKRYRLYAKYAEKLNGQVKLSQADYEALSGGFCSVVYFSIPGVMNTHAYADVPKSLVQEIRFPSLFAMMTLGLTGDLVAAETDDDGWLFVRRVLCQDGDPDYARCAARYLRGRFEAVDGREVGLDLKPKAHGARIDAVTFRRIVR